MVEKTVHRRRKWRGWHSKEVTLRLAQGQTQGEIGAALGWQACTIRCRIANEQLDRSLSLTERLTLVDEVEAEKMIESVLDVATGTAAHARLWVNFRMLRKQLSAETAQESDVRTHKAIREMSDDELRAYVASLVPGLEIKGPAGDGPRGPGTDGEVSVPEDGADGSETTKPGGELA